MTRNRVEAPQAKYSWFTSFSPKEFQDRCVGTGHRTRNVFFSLEFSESTRYSCGNCLSLLQLWFLWRQKKVTWKDKKLQRGQWK